MNDRHRGGTTPLATSSGDPRRPRILILTSSLLTDRMLAPTSVLPRLAAEADVRVLATSLAADHPGAWPEDSETVTIAAFPKVSTVRFFPTGLTPPGWGFVGCGSITQPALKSTDKASPGVSST